MSRVQHFHIPAGCGINNTRGETTLTPTLGWSQQVQETTFLQVNMSLKLR